MQHHTISKVLLGSITFASVGLFSLASFADPIVFPARASDLAPGEFIATFGHAGGKQANALDVDVRRFDANTSSWVNTQDQATAPFDLEDHLIYGLPVYAPEDGYVVACFNNYEDATDLVNPCDGGCPNDVFAGGNYIVVSSHDDDHAYVVAHLQEGSIPPHLCPNSSTTTDNTTAQCAMASPFNEGIPETTQLDLVNPSQPFPEVIKGEPIGNIGFTGNTTAPHTHFEVFEWDWDVNGRFCKGPSLPMEFYETWSQVRNTNQNVSVADWVAMLGDTVIDDVFTLLYPGAIGAPRDDHDYNLDASTLHATTAPNGGVMAYLDGSGNLDVRSYDLDTDGQVITQSLVNEGAVIDLAIARPNTTRSVIVAIRGANDNLKLIPYAVTNAGAITRQVGKEVTEGDIGMVAAIKSPKHDGVVVAVEDQFGNLLVIDYSVDSSLNITRETGDGTGSIIDAVELTGLSRTFHGVVTAELIAGTDSLRLRSFDVPASGGVTNADVAPTLLGGTDIDIDTVVVNFGLDEYVVTALRQDNGTLRIDVWDVDAQGDITWVSTESAGLSSEIDGTAIGLEDYLTSVRDSNGNLRLIGWSIDGLGEIRRTATERYDLVTDAISLNSLGAPGHIETLYTDVDGELRLLTVEHNFIGGI